MTRVPGKTWETLLGSGSPTCIRVGGFWWSSLAHDPPLCLCEGRVVCDHLTRTTRIEETGSSAKEKTMLLSELGKDAGQEVVTETAFCSFVSCLTACLGWDMVEIVSCFCCVWLRICGWFAPAGRTVEVLRNGRVPTDKRTEKRSHSAIGLRFAVLHFNTHITWNGKWYLLCDPFYSWRTGLISGILCHY